MATNTGRISLSGDHVTITDGGKKQKLSFSSVDDYHRLLSKYFGLSAE
jgi:hypothetical protein